MPGTAVYYLPALTLDLKASEWLRHGRLAIFCSFYGDHHRLGEQEIYLSACSDSRDHLYTCATALRRSNSS
ncbi:hypothetical protein XAP7430_1140007 [Xanthomonas phaseoli pv. phaseoli]|uniref:Uncharacterized protein n=1 Tax=Xanthomonas campestris pv. phaseoli TaxID=317013 RepID=A0AB38DVC5_XANCH|nr:hypothetical protein XAP6984_1170007 [Xanthomonas phaseoli pv. phaseoli]SON80544.1 hypothetical protein XAP7430_1140007 [Xanthomonas phaseoli pv. phaseoli]